MSRRFLLISALFLSGACDHAAEEAVGVGEYPPEPHVELFKRFGPHWRSEGPSFWNLSIMKNGEVSLEYNDCDLATPLKQTFTWTQQSDGSILVTPLNHMEGEAFEWGLELVYAVKIREGSLCGRLEVLSQDEPHMTYWRLPVTFVHGHVCRDPANCQADLTWCGDLGTDECDE